MDPQLDYLDHLHRESHRFVEALVAAAPDTRVPSCPDWQADDLLWHLAEVQWFWGTIVRERLLDPAPAEVMKDARPTDREGLTAFYDRASRDLQRILAETAPDTEVWTWSSEQNVGFVRRRQAHEALIHRVDAELTAGARTPIDRRLATDGVDEVLRVMYGGAPPWGTFTSDEAKTIRLQATDTEKSWLVTLGRFSGTDPDEGTSYDERDLCVADIDSGSEAAATVAGEAADLDCWLWHRPPEGPLERTGAAPVLAELDATLAPGID